MAFDLPRQKTPISDDSGARFSRPWYSWFVSFTDDISENFRLIKAILEGLGASTDDTSDIITGTAKTFGPKQYHVIETDDDPPTIPTDADEGLDHILLTIRSDGTLQEYFYDADG